MRQTCIVLAIAALLMLLLVVAAFLVLDFHITQARSNVEFQSSTYSTNVSSQTPLPLEQPTDLYVQDRSRLGRELGERLVESLVEIQYIGEVNSREGEPQAADGSVIVIDVRDSNIFWTPVFGRSTFDVQVSYASDGEVDWIEEDVVRFVDGDTIARIRANFHSRHSVTGLMSLPGFYTVAADELAARIRDSLQSSLVQASQAQPPPDTETPPASELTWERITIPGAGVSITAPEFWEAQGGTWAWSNANEPGVYLGLQVEAISPPQEIEALLFPSPMAPSRQAVVRGAGGDLPFGENAVDYLVEVIDPNSGEVLGLEAHIIIMQMVGEENRAYDFYLGALDENAMSLYVQSLQTMASSAVFSDEPGAVEPGTVEVFFDNTDINPQGGCGAAYPVRRDIPQDTDPLVYALQELFRGPSPAETEQGFRSFFSESTANAFLGAKVEDKTAYVNMADLRSLIPNASSSCGSVQFFAEVENTVRSATPEVDRVLYAIDGAPSVFYDWVQLGCGDFNDNCDAQPFVGLGD